MEKYKTCQRCANSFECNVNNIENCQCSTVTVTKATQDFLKKTNYDCLCKECLTELNILSQKATISRFPKNANELLRNTHFYIKNGNFVFTEFYHFQRGHCCQNDCRHCAYGFGK